MRSKTVIALTAAPIAVALFLAAPSHDTAAGLATRRGDERGYWEQDRTSVVVAVLRDLRRAPDHTDIRSRHATLVPMATVSGSFDPGLHPTLPVRLWVVPPGTSIRGEPPEGATVMAVIAQQDDGYLIVPDVCAFMPEPGAALVVVDGPGDPKVAQTLKRIQDVRLAARKKQQQLPASKPKAAAAGGNHPAE
jgi:hypothetical protein